MTKRLVVRNYTSQSFICHVAEQAARRDSGRRQKIDLSELDGVKAGLRCSGTSEASNVVTAAERPEPHRYPEVQVQPFGHSLILVPVSKHGRPLRLVFVAQSGVECICEFPLHARGTDFGLNGDGEDAPFLAIKLESAILALVSRIDTKQWMRALPDTMPLELLSIPGTHNSPACYRALPSVRCQAVSLREQLERGVRFLDVRLQVDDPNNASTDTLSLVHSFFPVALFGAKSFRSLCKEVMDFLTEHSSETILLSVKREGSGRGTDADLAQRLLNHYLNDEHWVLRTGIPILGEARGKIVLLRRFIWNGKARAVFPDGVGIDAEVWADNSPCSWAGDVHVQDFYEVLRADNVDKKIQYIREHCERACLTARSIGGTTPSSLLHRRGALFLNFMSASNFWRKGCWPERIARKVNPGVTQYLCEIPAANMRSGMGILAFDWIGEDGNWDLVHVIIAMNEILSAEPC